MIDRIHHVHTYHTYEYDSYGYLGACGWLSRWENGELEWNRVVSEVLIGVHSVLKHSIMFFFAWLLVLPRILFLGIVMSKPEGRWISETTFLKGPLPF